MTTLTEQATVERADVTARLADLALQTRLLDLPDDVVHDTERLILDIVGCTLAGFATLPGRTIADQRLELGGRPDATLFTSGHRLPCTSVAFVHSQLANLVDGDETLEWAHFSCAVVMPALAVAELRDQSGGEVVAAVAAGYDVAARVMRSMPVWEIGPDGRLRKRSGLGQSWAAFGTAAACGRLLGLSDVQLATAFGIVAVTTPVHSDGIGASRSLHDGPGGEPWSKYAMYGTIAEAGLNAVLLAEKGFVANAAVLDRGSKFFCAFGADHADHDVMTEDLGSRWFVSEATIKPWPTCRLLHPAVTAFNQIVHTNGLHREEIEAVRVTIPPYDNLRRMVESTVCSDPYKVQSSLPYAFAMIASGVPVGPKWLDTTNLSDPAHCEFARRVTSAVDDSQNDSFLEPLRHGRGLNASRVPTVVEVSARGTTYRESAMIAAGDPTDESSRLNDKDLFAKVRSFSLGSLSDSRIDRVIEAAMCLHTSPSISALADACRDGG